MSNRYEIDLGRVTRLDTYYLHTTDRLFLFNSYKRCGRFLVTCKRTCRFRPVFDFLTRHHHVQLWRFVSCGAECSHPIGIPTCVLPYNGRSDQPKRIYRLESYRTYTFASDQTPDQHCYSLCSDKWLSGVNRVLCLILAS